MKKYFFGDFFHTNIWQKTPRVNKNAKKSFSRNLSFGVDFGRNIHV